MSARFETLQLLRRMTGRWRGARPMTVEHAIALLHLAEVGKPLKLFELRAVLGVSKPRMTRYSDELAALGLITKRTDHKGDSRDRFVEITDDGRAFAGVGDGLAFVGRSPP